MKRRFFSPVVFFITLILVFHIFNLFVSADYHQEEFFVARSVVFFEDGSREETSITQVQPSRILHHKVGSIIRSYYNSSDTLIWRVKLTGLFSYNGVTSSCDDANTTITFYESGWSTLSENTSCSGFTAQTAVVLGKRYDGITLPTANVNMSLSCDKDGNLS
ncbi:MAG: hypothetical protein IKQ54_11820 [Oscillospiraceae bacterium]|nr:hypothetical protein [Oscillospiraceae bacterium]MBR4193810.1 hypothetical protein [Oscillospiraceae bacterium]MBR4194999.1 hypothetical protein [Oscillospiraceae bacterium]